MPTYITGQALEALLNMDPAALSTQHEGTLFFVKTIKGVEPLHMLSLLFYAGLGMDAATAAMGMGAPHYIPLNIPEGVDIRHALGFLALVRFMEGDGVLLVADDEGRKEIARYLEFLQEAPSELQTIIELSAEEAIQRMLAYSTPQAYDKVHR